MELYFCTGNAQKFSKGKEIASQHGITLKQLALDVDEVQSEDTRYVAQKKIEAAYDLAQCPVLISDDAWIIPGLNGFPGTYAKSVNTWFTPDDYIRLTKDLSDRRIFLRQTFAFQDGKVCKFFVHDNPAVLLPEARGEAGISIQKVVGFEEDEGKSISEMIGSGSHYRGKLTVRIWDDFCNWYTEYVS